MTLMLNRSGNSSNEMRFHPPTYLKKTYGGFGRFHFAYAKAPNGVAATYGTPSKKSSANKWRLSGSEEERLSLFQITVWVVPGIMNEVLCSASGGPCPIS